MVIVWIVMNDLTGIVTNLPIKGITIPYFVGPKSCLCHWVQLLVLVCHTSCRRSCRRTGPFAIAIQNAVAKGLHHVINPAILTSAWLAGNASLFSGSRILYGPTPTYQAPTNKRSVPCAAVLTTWLPCLLASLTVSDTSAQVFDWFVNISMISGYTAWIVCLIVYIRFRQALSYQVLLHTLPYTTLFQPYATWLVLCAVSMLTLTHGF